MEKSRAAFKVYFIFKKIIFIVFVFIELGLLITKKNFYFSDDL